MLGNIRATIQHEGREMSYQTVEGTIENQPYEQFHGELTIMPEEVIQQPLEYFVDKFRQMGIDAASQIARFSFQTIDKVIDKTGNKIDAKGKNYHRISYSNHSRCYHSILIQIREKQSSPRSTFTQIKRRHTKK